jgi:hypothetical protein
MQLDDTMLKTIETLKQLKLQAIHNIVPHMK